MRIVDAEGRLLEVAERAWDSGVVMDVGHGTGSFSFETAEALMAAGRKPDVISTDLHQLSVNGPAFDLPTTLSKFIQLGMSLREVVEAATARPAAVLGLEREVGTLQPGSRADIALFRLFRGTSRCRTSMATSGMPISCSATRRRSSAAAGSSPSRFRPERSGRRSPSGRTSRSRSPRSSGSCASSGAPPTPWRPRPAKRR